jgi:hypothetical protein
MDIKPLEGWHADIVVVGFGVPLVASECCSGVSRPATAANVETYGTAQENVPGDRDGIGM